MRSIDASATGSRASSSRIASGIMQVVLNPRTRMCRPCASADLDEGLARVTEPRGRDLRSWRARLVFLDAEEHTPLEGDVEHVVDGEVEGDAEPVQLLRDA